MKDEAIGKMLIMSIGIIILSWGIYRTLYLKYLDSLPQNYTVGIIEKVWTPAKGGRTVSYYYWTKERKFQSSVKLGSYENMAKSGCRFLVKYPIEHIDEGVLLLDKPVPDSVVAPENGWDEIPNFAR